MERPYSRICLYTSKSFTAQQFVRSNNKVIQLRQIIFPAQNFKEISEKRITHLVWLIGWKRLSNFSREFALFMAVFIANVDRKALS